MTNKEMYDLYQKGATFQKIGDMCGISKQAVHQRMVLYERKVYGIRGKRKQRLIIDKIVYKGIYEHFKNNYKETITSMCKKVYGYAVGTNCEKFKRFIIGEHDSHFKLKQMERLCEVIGKPFEEVFERRDV